VFPAEGRKIGLLRHQVKVYRRSLQVVSKQPLKGPCSVPWVCSWQSFDLLQICLSRGRSIFVCQGLIKPGLMMQFSRRAFFASRITQWISPHGVHAADHDMRQRTPITRVGF
jgi:hypothetical protein